ncbi:MAG: hypothetical protein KBT11_02315 [Treponema sp.]|nr:hypothetical protein [Candidatus Treponema equifaecale]
MKKIVLTAAAVAMAASMASADVSINIAGRMQTNAFQRISTETKAASTATATTNKYFGMDKASGLGYGGLSNDDTVTLKAEAENYGVTYAWNNTMDAQSNGIAKLNTLNVWMKFNNGLKVRAGAWKDGFADGAYRVKSYGDASALQGNDWEGSKLGGVYKGLNTTFIDNMAGLKGSELANSAFVEYDLEVGDGKLNLLGGLVRVNYKEQVNAAEAAATTLNDGTINTADAPDSETTTFYAGPVFRALYKSDAANAQFIWKNAGVKEHAFGLYVMPNITKELTLNVGGALGFTKGYNDAGVRSQSADMALESWTAELRAQYKTGALMISSYNSITQLCLEAGAKDAKFATAGVLNKNVVTGVDIKSSNMAMWNELGAKYDVDDAISVGGTIGLLTPLSVAESAKGVDAAESLGVQVRITPWVQFRAAKSAYVDLGLTFATTENEVTKGTKVAVTEFAVPVVVRVKM